MTPGERDLLDRQVRDKFDAWRREDARKRAEEQDVAKERVESALDQLTQCLWAAREAALDLRRALATFDLPLQIGAAQERKDKEVDKAS
jgi:crotonobetainyl-CoA:carnitine CoA-transferase CaiB-like acyl-CoA transferase